MVGQGKSKPAGCAQVDISYFVKNVLERKLLRTLISAVHPFLRYLGEVVRTFPRHGSCVAISIHCPLTASSRARSGCYGHLPESRVHFVLSGVRASFASASSTSSYFGGGEGLSRDVCGSCGGQQQTEEWSKRAASAESPAGNAGDASTMQEQ